MSLIRQKESVSKIYWINRMLSYGTLAPPAPPLSTALHLLVWDIPKLLTFRNAFWCKLPLMYSGDFHPNRHRCISRLFCSYSHRSLRIVLLFRRINASQLKNDTKNINHSFILIPYTSYKYRAMGWKLFMKEVRFFFHTPAHIYDTFK